MDVLTFVNIRYQCTVMDQRDGTLGLLFEVEDADEFVITITAEEARKLLRDTAGVIAELQTRSN